MSEAVSLKKLEKKAFKTAHGDGLWDIFLGCFLLMFAVAPLLSASLGDFWSSAVFLPFWGLVYLAVRLLRTRVVAPRVGTFKLGRTRKAKLRKFSIVMLVANVIALILGIIAARTVGSASGSAIVPFAGLIFLVGCSVAAGLLDLPRLYVYGLMIGLSPLVGEWLWVNHKASHHGFPVTFGITAAVMIVIGLFLFVRLLRDNPLPVEGLPTEEA
jgi:hypothetical protein